jgi:SAM-dependent methyltransferase
MLMKKILIIIIMLIKESEFLKKIILDLPGEQLKILNFGSQSSKYLLNQPHILENIIKPTTELGHRLLNLDINEDEGVDISGDIFDDVFFNKLMNERFDVIFVFNLLEHVVDIQLMISRIQQLIKPGKYILYSGPFKFPVHHDPIDNGFRPDIKGISRLFSDCDIIIGRTIIDYSYWKYLFVSLKSFLFSILRLLGFFYKFNKWRSVVLPKYKW